MLTSVVAVHYLAVSITKARYVCSAQLELLYQQEGSQMRQLFQVPAADSCPRARDAAIALLDRQLAAEGAFVLADGSVMLLELTRNGWRIRYWEPLE